MAFSSLFSSLPNKDVTPAESRERNEWQQELVKLKENEKDARIRKRPLRRVGTNGCRKNKNSVQQEEQSNLAKKSKLRKGQTLSYTDFDSEAQDYSMVSCDYEQPHFDFSKELDIYSRSKGCEDATNPTKKSDWKNTRQGEADGIGPKKNIGQQKNQQWEQQRNTAERGRDFARQGGRANKQHRAGSDRGGGCSNRDGGRGDRGRGRDRRGGFRQRDGSSKRGTDRSHRGGRQFPDNGHLTLETLPETRTKYMTKEFKDQNAIEIDGRLICRHFLRGKCIKGDDCQLEHAVDVNYSINELCKFYVQGFCLKGESCMYMHKSFPCKFFHTHGNCKQADQCRFSHEPLTDLTKQLLESALNRDKDVQELAKKDEPITEEPGTTEETVTDIFLNPLRPNFYNSTSPSEAHAEETPLCQNEVSAKVLEKEIDPPTDTTCRLDPPSNTISRKELVSYSVEAVLGSHKPLGNPFSSFFSPPVNQSATLQPTQTQPDPPEFVSRLPLNSEGGKGNAPYSVKAVLGFQKPADEPPCGPISGSVSQTTSPSPPMQNQPGPYSALLVPTDPTWLSDHLTKRPACSAESNPRPQEPVERPFGSLFAGPVPQSAHHPPTKTHPPAGCNNPAPRSAKAAPEPNGTAEKPVRKLFTGPFSQAARRQRFLNPSMMSPGYEADAPERPVGNPLSRTTARQTRPNPPSATLGPSDPICSSAPRPVCKKRKPTVEAVRESQTSTDEPFRSLFAAPLTKTTSIRFRDCKESPSVEPLLKPQNLLEIPFRSLFAGPIGQTTEPGSNSQPDPFREEPKRQVPDPSPINGFPDPTERPSVLKTLFLRLSPCRQEGEQWSSNGCIDPGLRSQEGVEIVVGQFKEEVDVVVEEGIKEEVDVVVEEGIKEEVDVVVEEGIKEEVDDVLEEGIKEEVDDVLEEGIKEEVDDVLEEGIKEEVYEMVECDLRVEPLLIPLEPLICDVSLRDPRHALQVDVTLPRPAFALDVLWSLEDLAPVPPLPHQPPVPRTSPERPPSPAGLRTQPSPQDNNSQEAAGESLALSGSSGGSNVQVVTPGIHNLPVAVVVRMTQPNFDVRPKRLAGQMRSNNWNVGDNKTLKDFFKSLDPTAPPFGH